MNSDTNSAAPEKVNNDYAKLPLLLVIFGGVAIASSMGLAVRLIWEMTVWSWERGPQMIGFQLTHGSPLLPLILGPPLLAIWFLIVVAMTANSYWRKKQKISRKRWAAISLAICVYVVLSLPEGFWQRMFIEKFNPERAQEFFIHHAATGDLMAVKAFLNRGVNINAQGRSGTALHGAVVEGHIDVIEYLIAQGADVNAIGAYGDSPLGYAQDARDNSAAIRELLTAHGAKLVVGSTEQRKRVIDEQVRHDMEKWDKESGAKAAKPCAPVDGNKQPPSTRSCR